jgi:uncharacterized protein
MLVGKPSHPKPLWLTGALASLVIACSAAAFIPPPPPQNGVDCNAKVYAIDTVVCDDPDLLAMDRAVRSTSDAGAEPPESRFFEAHETWFRRRGLCAMVEKARDCVAAAYSERLAIQKALGTNPTPAPTEMKCSPAPWKGSVRASITPEWITLLDSEGSVRGVAVPMTTSGWRPILGALKSGTNNLELRDANGVIRCRAAKKPSR